MSAPTVFPAIGDLLQLAVRVDSGHGHIATARQDYRVTAIGGSPDSIAVVAADWATQIAAPLHDLINNDASVIGAIARKIWPLPAGFTYVAGITPVVGTAGADPMPPQASYLITKQSASPGRRGRGRFYAPLPSQSQLDPTGALTAGAFTLLATLATFLENPVVTGAGVGAVTLQPVVAAVIKGPPPTLSEFDVVQCFAHNNFATQRRRGPFRVAHS